MSTKEYVMENCYSDHLLMLYLKQECSGELYASISGHLKECAVCREKVGQFQISFQIEAKSAEVAQRTFSMPLVSASDNTIFDVTETLETMSDGYEILGELPRGGQAAVFKAIQKATKRVVAVKVLLRGKDAPKIARYRFEKEIELAANLRHPNIVTIYDSGVAQGQYYYAMEFISGVPLDEYVKMHQLSVRQTLSLFVQVVSGVAYAHQKGVIHRDLKPGNILVDEQGKPHILDFGLAKMLEPSSITYEGSVMMSITGQVLGTLAYMAPEQAAGQVEDVDVRTDVYALGVILYKLLTGQFPYAVVGSALDIIKNIQNADPDKPSKITKVDSEIDVIVLKALAKEPAYRYQSASELCRDIENWLQGFPILARADNSLYLLYKLIRRHRFATSVASLLLLIIVAFGAVSFDLYRTADAAQGRAERLAETRTEQMRLYQSLAKRISLTMFLEAWGKDDLTRAEQHRRFYEMMFGDDVQVNAALSLLMDTGPRERRDTSVIARFADEQAWLAYFVMAEDRRKAGQNEEALSLYQQSVSGMKLLDTGAVQVKNWLGQLIVNRQESLEYETGLMFQ